MIRRFFRWLHQVTCPHIHKKEMFRSYPDRYIKEKCNDCGKIIWSEL